MKREKTRIGIKYAGGTIDRSHIGESTQNLTSSNRGITLIALVITIIIMLILVGVSVTIALNGGLFSTAKQAKRDTKEAIEAEQTLPNGRIKIDGTWYDSFDDYINGNPSKEQNIPSYEGCTECSKENPHIITNKYEFDAIRTHINTNEDGTEYIGGYFKLKNDIIFDESDFEEGGYFYNYNETKKEGEGFIPIGLKKGPYDSLWNSANFVYTIKINLNGNNKELKNIKIRTSESIRDYNAIIARLDEGGKIYDLGISNLNVYAATSVGGLVRTINPGSEIQNITIKNSICTAYKSMGDMKASGLVAGYLGGKVRNVQICNCKMDSYSWNGALVAGQIGGSADIDGIKIYDSYMKTYVDSGIIAASIIDGSPTIKNIEIASIEADYYHNDVNRIGILFKAQEGNAENGNPVIFENLNMSNIKILNENIKKLVVTGAAKLINSRISVENVKVDTENIELGENSIIE